MHLNLKFKFHLNHSQGISSIFPISLNSLYYVKSHQLYHVVRELDLLHRLIDLIYLIYYVKLKKFHLFQLYYYYVIVLHPPHLLHLYIKIIHLIMVETHIYFLEVVCLIYHYLFIIFIFLIQINLMMRVILID